MAEKSRVEQFFADFGLVIPRSTAKTHLPDGSQIIRNLSIVQTKFESSVDAGRPIKLNMLDASFRYALISRQYKIAPPVCCRFQGISDADNSRKSNSPKAWFL